MRHDSLDTTKKYTKLVDASLVRAVQRLARPTAAVAPAPAEESDRKRAFSAKGPASEAGRSEGQGSGLSGALKTVEVKPLADGRTTHRRLSVTSDTLRPGAKCIWNSHLLHFVERIPQRGSKPAMNVFRADDFVGLSGEDDEGLVNFTDRRLKELQWV